MTRISSFLIRETGEIRGVFFFSLLAALTLLFLAVAAANLGNYWPVTADDGWIMSASYKWAEEGVFGSDMYRGYFNADRHYFMALPTQHLLLTMAFRLAGASIESARWVTLSAAVVLLWTVVWLAWRWYGPAVAACTALLLLFWRSGLLGEANIPLLHVSRTARYDLTAVTMMWLSVLSASLWLQRPRRVWALAAGFFTGMALLAQFFAGAILLILGGVWYWGRRRRQTPPAAGLWLLAGLALPLLPYLLYVARHWPDAVGQMATQQSYRLSFGPSGLLQNLLQEGQRFRRLPQLAQSAAGPWLLLLGVGPAALYLLHRLRRRAGAGDVVLALSGGASLLFLALVDSTKAPVYAIVLLPPLCLLLGLLLGAVARQARRGGRRGRWLPALGLFLLLAPVVAEGLIVYQRERRRALSVISYEQVSQTISREIPAGARVAGAERWWWPLRRQSYLALNSLWLRWDAAATQAGPRPTFGELAADAGLSHILVNDNVRGDISHRQEQLQQQFWSYLRSCTTVQATWRFETYGEIALHLVQGGCQARP